MKSKKLLTSVVALGTAAALALGGTFAWQSISQTALNERSDIVNPGGRLHDDFDGSNKDVYVENFADEDIFARVRLEEYFEIVMNYGVEGAETVISMIGSKTEKTDDSGDPVTTADGTQLYDYAYEVFKDYSAGYSVEAGNVDGYSWWHWDMGSDTVFMPTFNKNKDSLQADVNGEYKFDTGVITSKDIEGGQYTEMVTYTEGETLEGQAIYDADSNKLDEVGSDFENLQTYVDANNIKLVTETHTAKATPSGMLMSMEDWLAAVEEDGYNAETDAHWVYDTDGWVYWSAPIKAGEATGLLLDGIELNQVMDDTWYYAINVVGQFVTANDVGKANSTGFYQDADEAPSADAETLLKTIGVTIGEDSSEEESGPTLQIEVTNDQTWYFPSENTLGATVNLEVTGATIYDYSKNWGEDGFATEVPDSEFANIQWSVSGNTSESTVLSETTGKTTTLTIGNDETAKIYIYAKLTYNDITGEGCVYIDNEPYVVSSQIYHLNGKVLSGRDYYEAGKANEYELLFFPVYYSAVSDYSREEAHTGKAHEYLAEGTTWALGHIENYQFVEDESIEGVTLTQNESDPAKVTLTIEEGYNGTFALGATNSEGTTYYSELKPKVASISLSWPEGVTDDGTNVAVNLTGVNSVKPTASYTETTGNEELESRTCYFYAKKVNVTTGGYQVLKDMTEEVWIIYSEDIDAEYGWQVDDGDRLIEISEDDGSITVNQELAENINFTYEMHVSCEGYEIIRNVSVAAGTSSAGGGQTEKDWSELVTMRNIITSAEYDLLCDATGDVDSLMHYDKIYSWTTDVKEDNEMYHVTRGSEGRYTSYAVESSRTASCGWRPAFRVQNPDTDCTDLNIGDVVVMGTLYVGSASVKVPATPTYKGDITNYDKDGLGVTDKLTIGTALEDTDYQMKAIYIGDGVFVCDRVMLNYISWNQLTAALSAD